MPALEPAEPSPPQDHVVQFYDSDATLVQGASAFLAAGLGSGSPGVAVSTARRLPLFERELAGMGLDVPRLIASRQLVLLDARELLDGFVVDGVLDESRFRESVASMIVRTTEAWRPARLHAYGEMVDLLWADGHRSTALALEELWSDLARKHDFSLYCAYSADHFERDEERAGFDAICSRHGRIMPIAVTTPAAI